MFSKKIPMKYKNNPSGASLKILLLLATILSQIHTICIKPQNSDYLENIIAITDSTYGNLHVLNWKSNTLYFSSMKSDREVFTQTFMVDKEITLSGKKIHEPTKGKFINSNEACLFNSNVLYYYNVSDHELKSWNLAEISPTLEILDCAGIGNAMVAVLVNQSEIYFYSFAENRWRQDMTVVGQITEILGSPLTEDVLFYNDGAKLCAYDSGDASNHGCLEFPMEGAKIVHLNSGPDPFKLYFFVKTLMFGYYTVHVPNYTSQKFFANSQNKTILTSNDYRALCQAHWSGGCQDAWFVEVDIQDHHYSRDGIYVLQRLSYGDPFLQYYEIDENFESPDYYDQYQFNNNENSISVESRFEKRKNGGFYFYDKQYIAIIKSLGPDPTGSNWWDVLLDREVLSTAIMRQFSVNASERIVQIWNSEKFFMLDLETKKFTDLNLPNESTIASEPGEAKVTMHNQKMGRWTLYDLKTMRGITHFYGSDGLCNTYATGIYLRSYKDNQLLIAEFPNWDLGCTDVVMRFVEYEIHDDRLEMKREYHP